MDSGQPSCYLSFPDDARSAAAAAELRAGLEERGVVVLPPATPDKDDTTLFPFRWLRQSDAVVLDVTGDSTWVVYEAGAARALNKFIIGVTQPTERPSELQWELPRIYQYELSQIDSIADHVMREIKRNLSPKS